MIPIIFSTDHNFVMPTAITISSLLTNSHDTHYDINVLVADNVTEDDKSNLIKEVQTSDFKSIIRFIPVGNVFEGCYEVREISTAAYFRLLIPWLLPQYNKVIYCDGDVIIQDSLKDVFEIPIDEIYVAGVNTPGYQQNSFKSYCSQYDLDPSAYLNSGFIVMNTKRMREDNLKDIYLKHALKQYTFQDQDIINIVCKGKTKKLSRAWNYLINYSKNEQGLQEDVVPTVLHYAGAKPWKTFTPYWREWWNIYKKSVFYNEEFYIESEKKILESLVPIDIQIKRKIKRFLGFHK